jgi:hypothetical protein
MGPPQTVGKGCPALVEVCKGFCANAWLAVRCFVLRRRQYGLAPAANESPFVGIQRLGKRYEKTTGIKINKKLNKK